ncbi:MAG: thiamine phosphate synthase [Planctomycetota bacterium]|nr:thiamine phosphate synthase [Planctomycetota bacterium]MDP6764037.1 thiamine phosphate synthase [Planctomycetota bacterium]MDP6988005.1 thiamine phosphate synthase [Planctomycetota bacterium]
MTTPRLPERLLALTPGRTRDADGAARLARSVGAACEAGLRSVLIREPLLGDGDLLVLARRLVDLARTLPGLWIGVHDRVHVALAAGAHGVHVGHRSLTVREARGVAGEGLCLGFSAHEHDAPSLREGADYLIFGPLHDTPSKRGLLPPTGHEALARCAGSFHGPVWAIGGLRLGRVRGAREAGAFGVAVLSDLLGAPDPVERARAWCEEPACRG